MGGGGLLVGLVLAFEISEDTGLGYNDSGGPAVWDMLAPSPHKLGMMAHYYDPSSTRTRGGEAGNGRLKASILGYIASSRPA